MNVANSRTVKSIVTKVLPFALQKAVLVLVTAVLFESMKNKNKFL